MALVAAVSLSAMMGTACTKEAAQSDSQEQKAAQEMPSPVSKAWSIEGAPLGPPEIASGVAVALLAGVSEGPQIRAVDVKTGQTLWSDAVSAGSTVPGVSIHASIVGADQKARAVAYLAPAAGGGEQAHVVIADLKTGRQLHRTQPLYVTGWPDQCPDKKDVCFVGSAFGVGSARLSRLLLSDAKTTFLGRSGKAGDTEDVYRFPMGARELGSNIIDLGYRSPEKLALLHGDSLAWTLPVDEMFSPGSSSDGGWSTVRDEKRGISVISLGAASFEGTRRIDTLLSTAGVDDRGRVLWRREGEGAWCLDRDPHAPLSPRQAGIVFLCRGDGTITRGGAGAQGGSPAGATVTGSNLAAVDAATGKDVWSTSLQGFDLLGAGGDSGTIIAVGSGSDAMVVNVRDDKSIVIDLATGKTRTAQADERFLCRKKTRYFDSRSSQERAGGQVHVPCTAKDAPALFDSAYESTPGTASKDVLDRVSDSVEGMWVIAEPQGLVAYRLK